MGLIINPYRFAAAGGGGGTTWTAARTTTFNSNNRGWQGYTLRERIDAAGLADLTGFKVRATLASSLTSLVIAKMYVGLAGTGVSFATTPTQMMFSGNPGVSLGASASVTSDGATLSCNGATDALVFSVYTNGTDDWYQISNSAANTQVAYKAGDDAATVSAPIGPGNYEDFTVTIKDIFSSIEFFV